MPDVGDVLQHVDDTIDQSIERLFELLRIPSVGTDPAHHDDTRGAAEWLRAQLAGIGFETSIRETPGNPMVVAHHPGPEGYDGPHLMYYGHYDVQPPDPLELWDSPPFEPILTDSPHGKRIVARGAVDDKGQLMLFVEAFRAWHETHGMIPARITVLLEGEEESGSPSLDGFLEQHRDELSCADVCIVSDTGMWDVKTPAITTMLRGLVYMEVTLHGPGMDLHSGMYGGAVLNPLNALTEMLGELHDADGRVQIPGFYDDVRELDDATRAQWEALGFDEKAFLAGAGLKTPSGEAGRSTLERIWARPTCDLNGIIGGYTGAGAKTVIGSSATAKLSCRLVADQDAKKIMAGVRTFFESRKPADGRLEFSVHGASPAIRVPEDSPYLHAAKDGLRQVFEAEPVNVGSGGSIPVVGSIERILGINSLLVGFGLDDDRMHSPNEKFEVVCYHNGIKSHVAMLDAFSGMA